MTPQFYTIVGLILFTQSVLVAYLSTSIVVFGLVFMASILFIMLGILLQLQVNIAAEPEDEE